MKEATWCGSGIDNFTVVVNYSGHQNSRLVESFHKQQPADRAAFTVMWWHHK